MGDASGSEDIGDGKELCRLSGFVCLLILQFTSLFCKGRRPKKTSA